MDFELSSEQTMLRDTVRSFCKQQSPVERFRELRAQPTCFDAEIWRHMGELGWLSVPFPESVGGFGGSFVDVAVLLEGFGRTLVPEPYIPSVLLGGMAVLEGGSPEQHQRWLAPMIEGQATLALGHAERAHRYAIDPVDTAATADGDGYRIVGQKTFVLAGHHADHIVVSAATREGIGLFVLDRHSPGVTAQPLRTIDGHGAALLQLDTRVDGDRLLGQPGPETVALLERVHDYAAAAACAEALGLAQSVLDMTVAHLKEREQFGVPIGTFQVLQHYTVDMFVQVQLMRSMSMLASIRAGDPDPDQRRHGVSAAKAHVDRSGRFVTQTAIQLHGGIGITDEHDVGLFFKRMQALGALFGDEDHHVRRFAALPAFTAGLT